MAPPPTPPPIGAVVALSLHVDLSEISQAQAEEVLLDAMRRPGSAFRPRQFALKSVHDAEALLGTEFLRRLNAEAKERVIKKIQLELRRHGLPPADRFLISQLYNATVGDFYSIDSISFGSWLFTSSGSGRAGLIETLIIAIIGAVLGQGFLESDPGIAAKTEITRAFNATSDFTGDVVDTVSERFPVVVHRELEDLQCNVSICPRM